MLRPPRATLVLGPRGARLRAERLRGARLGEREEANEEPPLPRPPPLPGTRDGKKGSISRLISLLPPDEGAPVLNPGRPPSPDYPLGERPSHRFPSALYERINADYVAKAPLGLCAAVPPPPTSLPAPAARRLMLRG